MLTKANGWMTVPIGDGFGRLRQPFQSNHLWAAAPDGSGVAIADLTQSALRADTSAVRVSQVSIDGETIFDVRVPLVIERMSAADVRAEAEDIARGILAQRGTAALDSARLVEQVAGSIERFEFVPPVRSLHIDADNRTWLALRPNYGQTELRWLVLDSGGMVVGNVAHSGDAVFGAAGRERVWFIEPSEEGGKTVRQYRLRGGS